MCIRLCWRSWVQSLQGPATLFRGDHEIFSTVILPLPLIQEGQLSVLVIECVQVLVNGLEDQACPGKSVVR